MDIIVCLSLFFVEGKIELHFRSGFRQMCNHFFDLCPVLKLDVDMIRNFMSYICQFLADFGQFESNFLFGSGLRLDVDMSRKQIPDFVSRRGFFSTQKGQGPNQKDYLFVSTSISKVTNIFHYCQNHINKSADNQITCIKSRSIFVQCLFFESEIILFFDNLIKHLDRYSPLKRIQNI